MQNESQAAWNRGKHWVSTHRLGPVIYRNLETMFFFSILKHNWKKFVEITLLKLCSSTETLSKWASEMMVLFLVERSKWEHFTKSRDWISNKKTNLNASVLSEFQPLQSHLPEIPPWPRLWMPPLVRTTHLLLPFLEQAPLQVPEWYYPTSGQTHRSLGRLLTPGRRQSTWQKKRCERSPHKATWVASLPSYPPHC